MTSAHKRYIAGFAPRNVPSLDVILEQPLRNCLKNDEAVGIVARIPHPVSLSQRAREVQYCPGSAPSPSGRGLG